MNRFGAPSKPSRHTEAETIRSPQNTMHKIQLFGNGSSLERARRISARESNPYELSRTMGYQHLFLSFQGRITRSAYWLATLVFFGINIVVSLIGTRVVEGTVGGIIILLAWLFIIYSAAAVAAKRWHDRNKSGWWSLVALVPVVGLVWMIVENGFLPGTPGPNRFGPSPIKAGKPTPVTYDGRKYFRHSDGSFTDGSGRVVRDAALLAALVSAYAAMRASGALDGHTGDYSTDDSPAGADATTESADRGGWSWFSGGDSGGSDSDGGGGGGD